MQDVAEHAPSEFGNQAVPHVIAEICTNSVEPNRKQRGDTEHNNDSCERRLTLIGKNTINYRLKNEWLNQSK